MAKKKLESHEGVPVEPFIPEFLVKPTVDEDGVQVSSAIGTDGKEYPDPVPMSPPVGYEPPIPLMDLMRMMIHRASQPDNEFEIEDTEAEASDFEIDDDPDPPLTDHEKADLDPPPAATPPADTTAVLPDKVERAAAEAENEPPPAAETKKSPVTSDKK